MAFILASDGRDDDVEGVFSDYREYLEATRDRFPPSAYALATSDWYFDFRDHRSPHDAHLKTAQFSELTPAKPGSSGHSSLVVTLLGAYRDGVIELHYPRVHSYSLNLAEGTRGHCDWRYDELRVSDRGTLIHEIEWSGKAETGRWLIEASDLEFRWLTLA